MVETFLLPLGPALVEACRVEAGMRVLDVAAGTGNASSPAAERGAVGRGERPDAGAAGGRS
jgi:predicted methyltransferase